MHMPCFRSLFARLCDHRLTALSVPLIPEPQIRLFTFLVGQQELLAVKTAMQRAKKTQIVARLMVEELAFFGIRNVRDVATCLAGDDQTNFPRASDWSFTRFYLPQAVAAGYTLAVDAGLLWASFEQLHHKHNLPGELEIPMESFARAVEIVLKESELRDGPTYRPDAALWNVAVRSCGYIQSRQATGQELAQTAAESAQRTVLPSPEPPSGSLLPILTYDERKLSPSFGYFFDARCPPPCVPRSRGPTSEVSRRRFGCDHDRRDPRSAGDQFASHIRPSAPSGKLLRNPAESRIHAG